MVDFLRANAWCSREEYLWVLSVGQIRLASCDYTHVEYFDEKDNNQSAGSAADLLMRSDVGTSILNLPSSAAIKQ